ncbi:MAG: hypothetical protein WA874_23240 [Chryseosolibacter sp.]
MSKNKLHEPFLLCIIIIASLLVLSVVPTFTVESLRFRKINLLADIEIEHIDSVEVAFKDSLIAKQDSVIQLVKETCRPGLTCIEDYSGDSTALYKFYKALTEVEKSKNSVRVAFYGDSFIEGDVFCGSFRDSLQSIFGGRGVGFVPITSGVAGFRNTIKHSFDNWRTSSLINRTDSTAEYGPAGYCFVPLDGNWVEYRPSKKRYLREFNTVKLYYKNYEAASVRFSVNSDTAQKVMPLKKSNQLQEWVYRGKNLKSIKFTFEPFDSLRLFGASFEDGPGLYVDNFSLRGNSGISLTGISKSMLTKFNSYRNYKLVILQFGLNMVVEDSLNYRAYVRRMVRVINNLKKSFPQASFLLMSVSDRSTNTTGRFETMNAIPAMRNAQRMIAQETGIAFWDMFQAMGGENSMVRFVTSKPALAAKDYTHLNFNGGKKLAGSLVKSLLYGHDGYEKKYASKK